MSIIRNSKSNKSKIISQENIVGLDALVSSASTATKDIVNPFIDSDLWIRLVDKKNKMSMLLDSAESIDDLTETQKGRLSELFRDEIGTYGDMMFNISNENVNDHWQFRNGLTPVLRDVLFAPSINVSTMQDDETEETSLDFNPMAIIEESLSNLVGGAPGSSTDRLGLTQIANLDILLDRIKSGILPGSHQEYNNQLRIQSLNVKWMPEGYTTREADLEIYLEHEQLLKTDIMKYLMTLNNRVKIKTRFIDLFEDSDEELFEKFTKTLDPETTLTLEKYKKFVNASVDDDEWVIWNFDTEFDNYNAVTIKLHMVLPGYNIKKRLDTDSVMPINLITPDVLAYFQEHEILKVGSTDLDSWNADVVEIPAIAVDNKEEKATDYNVNNKESSFIMIDAARFNFHLLWLWALEYRKLYNSTHADKVLNSNFLITFEMDMSEPGQFNNSSGRENGMLMNYLDTGDSEFKSISLFDYDKVKFWMGDFTDFAFKYNGTDVANWNMDIRDADNFILNVNGVDNKWLLQDLLTTAPQTDLIEVWDYQEFVISQHDQWVKAITQNLKRYKKEDEERTAVVSEEAAAAYKLQLEINKDYANRTVAESTAYGADPFSKIWKIEDLRRRPDVVYTPPDEIELSWVAESSFKDKYKRILKYDIYYLYPIFKTSLNGEQWVNLLNLSIPKFVEHTLKGVFQNRKDAYSSFSFAKWQNEGLTVTDFNDWKIESPDSSHTWSYPSSFITTQKYSDNKKKKTNNDGSVSEQSEVEKRENAINKQLSNINDFKVEMIAHGADYVNDVDVNTKAFLKSMLGDDNEADWVEIKVSDSTKHTLTQKELDIYTKIQKEVFNGLDDTAIALNKYYDNNILNLASNSETISELPYQLGSFAAISKSNKDYKSRIKKIKQALAIDGILAPSEQGKLQNTLSMLELMADSENSKTSNTKNIVKWVAQTKNGVDDKALFNAISGSDVFSSLEDIGIKDKIKRTLFDSLMYRANGTNLFVPKMKLYAPLFLYSAVEAASALREVTNGDEALGADDVYNLNSRIAPQAGMYKITELSYTIDNTGMWTQNWEALKMDYSFLNLTSKILDEGDMGDESINTFQVFEDTANYFDTNLVLNPNIYSPQMFAGLTGRTTAGEAYQNNLAMFNELYINNNASDMWGWLSDINKLSFNIQLDSPFVYDKYRSLLSFWLPAYSALWKDSVLMSDDITIDFDTNQFQHLWPLGLETDSKFFDYVSAVNDFSNKGLQDIFNAEWINVAPIRYCNESSIIVPKLAFSRAFKSLDCSQMSNATELSSLVNAINENDSSLDIEGTKGLASSFPVDDSDAHVANETIESDKSYVFEALEDLNNAIYNSDSVITLDVGTVITLQRLDHPSISNDLLFPENQVKIEGIAIDKSKLQLFDSIKFDSGAQKLANWRTTEKYIITEGPSIIGLATDPDSYSYYDEFINSTPIGGLNSWDKYVTHSTDSRFWWYEWLNNYSLGFASNTYGMSVLEYKQNLFIKYAWSFLTNFFDRFYTKKPFDRDDLGAGIYGEAREPAGFSDVFNQYVNYEDYEAAINQLQTWSSMEYLTSSFESNVQSKLKQYSVDNELDLKPEDDKFRLLNKKYESLKKDFSVLVLTTALPDFIRDWIALTEDRSEAVDLGRDWTIDSMLFDFILINTEPDKISAQKRFSAIRWTYDSEALGIENVFNGEFVDNMSVNQLLGLTNRNEKKYINKLGLDQEFTDITDGSSFHNKWFWAAADIEDWAISSVSDVQFDPGAGTANYSTEGVWKNKEGSTLDDYRRKYGRMRVLVNDRMTYKKLFLENNWEFANEKLLTIDKWNYDSHQKDVANVTFKDYPVGWNDPDNNVYSIYKQETGEDPTF
jgi:hypothetical protein